MERSGISKEVNDKFSRLKELLVDLESVLVAFSGGVDSTFLLKVASDVLNERVIAITIASPLNPKTETKRAEELAEELGVKHIVHELNQLKNEHLRMNPPDRCYLCKEMIFTEIMEIAKENEVGYILDGSNYDDLSEYRPGLKALRELGVISPLTEVGLTKEEIRILSKELGLSNYDEPSQTCLITRFPYGVEITVDKLRRVDRGEEVLKSLGFDNFRLRDYSDTARIEVVEGDISQFLDGDLRKKVVDRLKEFGYSYITLDLEGFRSGSMDEIL